MEITLREYCSILIDFFNRWKETMECKKEYLTECMDELNADIFCSNVKHSYPKKGLDVYMGTVYTTFVPFYNTSFIMHLECNEFGEWNLTGTKDWNSSCPDADYLFQKYYEEITDMCNYYLSYWDIIRKLDNIIPISDNCWLLSKFQDYSTSFTLSQDSSGFRKCVVFKKDNNWEPVYKRFNHREIEHCNQMLSKIFDTTKIDVTGMEKFFTENNTKKKQGILKKIFKFW